MRSNVFVSSGVSGVLADYRSRWPNESMENNLLGRNADLLTRDSYNTNEESGLIQLAIDMLLKIGSVEEPSYAEYVTA